MLGKAVEEGVAASTGGLSRETKELFVGTEYDEEFNRCRREQLM